MVTVPTGQEALVFAYERAKELGRDDLCEQLVDQVLDMLDDTAREVRAEGRTL